MIESKHIAFGDLPTPDYFLFWQEFDRQGDHTYLFDRKFPGRSELQNFVADLAKKNTLVRGSLRVITGYEVELVSSLKE